MKIAAALYQLAGDDRRDTERSRLDRPGTVRIADIGSREIIVADLTREGCRIETTERLHAGASVVIGIAGIGLSDARVMWGADGVYGCHFDEALPSGSVTAAMADNIHLFPELPDAVGPVVHAAPVTKYPLRARVAFLLGCVVVSWGAIAAIAVALVR